MGGRGATGFPVEGLGGGKYRVAGPRAESFPGDTAAVLVRKGSEKKLPLEPGATVELRFTGKHAGRVRQAIGTGPQLVHEGAVPDAVVRSTNHPEWEAPFFRAGIGWSKDDVWLVTSAQEPHNWLSMSDFARAMRRLGCVEATNLDGGPSPTLFAGGRVLNPQPSNEAEVASGILVLPPLAPDPGVR